MKSRRGFTLMEVLIVLTVSGIVLMWALPRIDIAQMRVRASEQAVTTALLAAQQRAVLKQHDVRVLFDTAASLLIIHDDLNNDGDRDAGEPERVVGLEDGVRFTAEGTPGSSAAVTFSADTEGFPELVFHRGGFGSESGRIHLGTERSVRGERLSDARRLDLERATGRVTRMHVRGGIWQRHRT